MEFIIPGSGLSHTKNLFYILSNSDLGPNSWASFLIRILLKFPKLGLNIDDYSLTDSNELSNLLIALFSPEYDDIFLINNGTGIWLSCSSHMQ